MEHARRIVHSGCTIHPLERRRNRERERERERKANNDTVLRESHASDENSRDARAHHSTDEYESSRLVVSLSLSLSLSLSHSSLSSRLFIGEINRRGC